jgi:hypothetical protein
MTSKEVSQISIEWGAEKCTDEPRCCSLILRDVGLLGVQDECARSLLALKILSLSHNKFTPLQGFQYFSNLVEVPEPNPQWLYNGYTLSFLS